MRDTERGPLRPRRGRGSLERLVLDAVASARDPLTPAQVRDALAGGDFLAYTTVLTALARLHEKGVLSRTRVGRAYAYSAVGDPSAVEASAAARRMRRVLESGGDRRGVLARFVADLQAEDEATLVALLEEARDRRDDE